MSSQDPPKSVRYQSLKKEGTLAFLAVFYFLIATNTQSGWLFLLSAFLIGILGLSLFTSKRSTKALERTRTYSELPQRGRPWMIKVVLKNEGIRAVREILFVDPANAWSEDPRDLRWVLPNLRPGQEAKVQYSVTPMQRGEHSLLGSKLQLGAPFGLFGTVQSFAESPKFLVYPKLLTLPLQRRRTRLSGLLSDFATPQEKGDSRTLRTLREYHPGDDLRAVHWKSTAKTGGRTLLVKEHTAPSRHLSLLVLDTSQRSSDEGSVQAFETSVSLAASMLWSAHREGTKSELLFLDSKGWRRSTRWEEQYAELARVQPLASKTFEAWCQQAEESVANRIGTPILLTSASAPAEVVPAADWPLWAGNTLLVTSEETAVQFVDYPVITVDAEGESVQELPLHV